MSKPNTKKSVIMVLVKIFATNHYLSTLFDRHDFNLGAIYAVVDNCTSVIVLNNLSLFIGLLEKVLNAGIVTVREDDHFPTHKGTTKLS